MPRLARRAAIGAVLIAALSLGACATPTPQGIAAGAAKGAAKGAVKGAFGAIF